MGLDSSYLSPGEPKHGVGLNCEETKNLIAVQVHFESENLRLQ
jgi:hypothetical protein